MNSVLFSVLFRITAHTLSHRLSVSVSCLSLILRPGCEPALSALFPRYGDRSMSDRYLLLLMLSCPCCWLLVMQGVAPRPRIEVHRDVLDTRVSSWWRAEPGPLKVVAIENGAGLVPRSPEGGGVVVAMVKADPIVHENESLLIYQSTKQLRIAGSGFDDIVDVSCYVYFAHCRAAGGVFWVCFEQERVPQRSGVAHGELIPCLC